MRRRWLSGLAAAGGVLLGAGCGGSGDDGVGDGVDACSVTAVSVAASPSTVDTAQTSTLTATVTFTGSCAGDVSWSASPDGATVTPSGTIASFSSTTAGTYAVTARSDDDTSVSGSAPVAVTTRCGTPNGTVITHSVSISADETWEGDGVTHSVPNDIRINAATVTVQPCAIVSLGENASIVVSGDPVAGEARLLAAGTSPDRFVAFVRADETLPWGILRGRGVSSFIELHHTLVRGGGSFGGQYRDPAIAMVGSAYSDLPVGVLEVDNVTIDGPQGAGVYFDTNAAFTSDSTQLVIQGAGDYPLVMTMMSVGSIPDGTYTGNAVDEILVFGQFNVFGDLTIRKRLPVRIQIGSMTVAAPINDTTPVTLTLEPGVELRFQPTGNNQPGARVVFGSNGNPPDNKVGVLIAQGTPADPIVFTSGADAPAPGDWAGLWLDTANGSRLDSVVIEYAGADNGITSANCRPAEVSDDAALVVGDFSDQYVPPANLITNSVIRSSAGNAINAVWTSPAFGPNLTGNGNTLTEIAECSQTYNALPGTCPMRGCY